MTDPREPIRLIASTDADPLLRDALRVIHEDAPSVPALGVVADNAERAVREGSSAQTAGIQAPAHSYPLAMKLVVAGVVAGALVYAGVQRARVDRRTRPDAPAQADEPARAPAHVRHAPSTSALRAADAPEPGQDAVVAPPDARAAAIESRPRRATQPAVAAPQPASHAEVAQPRDTVATRERPREAARLAPRSATVAERPAADTSPRRPQASQATHDARDEERGPAPAESEIALLEAAQHALLREPRRALELLDQHRSAFPSGAFAQERDVLILEAFQRLHDTPALREGARAFMQRYPRSPHRARVEKLVEDLR